MKLVSYDEFIKLPSGTIYSNYEYADISNLYIKLDTINDGKDWFYINLIGNLDHAPFQDSNFLQYAELCDKLEEGYLMPLDFECSERDGLFDYDRQFVIYETEDILNFRNKLNDILDTEKDLSYDEYENQNRLNILNTYYETKEK